MKGRNCIIAQNHRAYYEYFVEEVCEAGLVLQGTEVKSLRKGVGVALVEAHAVAKDGELFLLNLNIPEYTEANRFNHYAKRPRKLLLHKREIKKLSGLITRKGMTLIPIKLYFNHRNIVKVTIAVGKGKKMHDRREAIKSREWERRKTRIMKNGSED